MPRNIVNCPKCDARLEMADDAPEAPLMCPRCQAGIRATGESAAPQTALTPLPPAAAPAAAPDMRSEQDFANVDLRRPDMNVPVIDTKSAGGGFGVLGIGMLLGIALLLTSGFAIGRGWRSDLLHGLGIAGGGLLVLATSLAAI